MVALIIVIAVVVVFGLVLASRSIRVIPQARAGIVERLGRYSRTLQPGLTLVTPFIERVRPLVDLREQVVNFSPQSVITDDNVVEAIETAEGARRAAGLTAEGAKQAAVLSAEGERQAAILRAEGEARAIDTVFSAIHEGKPDRELLSYEYLQMLPQLAEGDANKVFVVPSEFAEAFGGIGEALSRRSRAAAPPPPPQVDDGKNP